MTAFYGLYSTFVDNYMVIGSTGLRRKTTVNSAGYTTVINSYIIFDSIVACGKTTVN